ncbi:MAG: imidazolonepropionase [Bacteroidaceae bacterium]|nr:imidazolonepropionase [Bacteroidaceae bacterium]
MNLLVKNIGTIVGIDESGHTCVAGKEMNSIATLEEAWLLTEGTRIKDYGPMSQLPTSVECETIDAQGGWLFPSFCDSHTHIVYAGSREQEFLDKIKGLSYEEIAAHGGGILNSADRLHNTSEEELYKQAMERIDEIIAMGTGLVEIKSGYGLTLESELKILRVIRRIKETAPLEVRSTFLGAHAVGRAFKGRQSEYVEHVCNEMIPAVAAENLADFVDIFCDRGFFTPEETAKIIERGATYGLRAKIHANELAVSGGVEVGVKHRALSVDHLESMGDEQIEALKDSNTIPTMLPGCAFFLGIGYPPARKMIDAGLPVALASDYNPGTAPSGNMRFVTSLASIKMKMTPAEALNAATLNSACAMGESKDYGSITRGKIANFYITKPIPSLAFMPYAHQTPIIKNIILKGKVQ